MTAVRTPSIALVTRPLIVEDDDATRRAIALHLKGERHRPDGSFDTRNIAFARAAPEAFAELDRQPVDFLLVDIGLPGELNGIDIVRSLRAAGNDVAILVYSSLNNGTNFRDAMCAGADHVVDLETLFAGTAAIERALQVADLRRRRASRASEIEEIDRQMARLRGAFVAPGVPALRTRGDILSLDEVCRRYVLEVIRIVGPEPKEICSRLEIPPRRLRRLLTKLGLDPAILFRSKRSRSRA